MFLCVVLAHRGTPHMRPRCASPGARPRRTRASVAAPHCRLVAVRGRRGSHDWCTSGARESFRPQATQTFTTPFLVASKPEPDRQIDNVFRDQSGARIVCHKIREDKGADTFKALVGNYRGVIVCDALKTHEAAHGATSTSSSQDVGRTCSESSTKVCRIIRRRNSRSIGSDSSMRSTSVLVPTLRVKPS
jgi:hypothetical protein